MKDRTAELRSVSSFFLFPSPLLASIFLPSPPILSQLHGLSAAAAAGGDGGEERLPGPALLRLFIGSAEVWMRVALRPGAFHAVYTELSGCKL